MGLSGFCTLCCARYRMVLGKMRNYQVIYLRERLKSWGSLLNPAEFEQKEIWLSRPRGRTRACPEILKS